MSNTITNDSTIQQRFWSKVDKLGPDECWNWLASKRTAGYGHFRLGKTMKSAHRISWLFVHGPIPEGMFILHICDNPSCVNPDHLFLGTHQDNADDKVNKGRHVPCKGSRNGYSKLTEEDIPHIRKLHDNGISQTAIAEEYGVIQATISKIVLGNSWTHV